MPETLELPNGDVVGPDDVFLYNDYPYRLVRLDGEEYAFELAPLYWGDSGMDVPFRDREALVDQWGADSRGRLEPAEWRQWVERARADERFGRQEVDAIVEELPIDGESGGGSDDGLLAGLLETLGLRP